MKMILPAATETSGRTPRRMNSRTASREHRKAPRRLTFITASHCVVVISWNGAFLSMPALLTRMSIVPNSRTAAVNIACTCASSPHVGQGGHGALPAAAAFLCNRLRVFGLRHVVDDHVRRGLA